MPLNFTDAERRLLISLFKICCFCGKEINDCPTGAPSLSFFCGCSAHSFEQGKCVNPHRKTVEYTHSPQFCTAEFQNSVIFDHVSRKISRHSEQDVKKYIAERLSGIYPNLMKVEPSEKGERRKTMKRESDSLASQTTVQLRPNEAIQNELLQLRLQNEELREKAEMAEKFERLLGLSWVKHSRIQLVKEQINEMKDFFEKESANASKRKDISLEEFAKLSIRARTRLIGWRDRRFTEIERRITNVHKNMEGIDKIEFPNEKLYKGDEVTLLAEWNELITNLRHLHETITIRFREKESGHDTDILFEKLNEIQVLSEISKTTKDEFIRLTRSTVHTIQEALSKPATENRMLTTQSVEFLTKI